MSREGRSASGRRTAWADLLWASKQLARKLFVTSVPFRSHVRIAAVRGRVYRALRGVPPHVRNNIAFAFPEMEPARIDRIAEGLCEFAARMYLWRLLPGLPKAADSRTWPVQGLEHLNAALERRKGVLLVTAHFGYGHIIPAALAAHGHSVARVIAELEHLEAMRQTEEWLAGGTWLRRYVHARTRVLADRLGREDMVAGLDVRPIFARLSSNGIVMTAGDGLRSMQFVELPLLGRSHPFPVGLMKIALASGASVLPVFAVQNGRAGRIRVEIHPAISLDPSLPVEENLRALVEVIEDQIRRIPELWHRWMIPNWFQAAQEWSNGDPSKRYKSELKEVVPGGAVKDV